MKLEKNMYVRTKEGIIEKIIDKYEAPYGYKVVVNEDFRFKHYEHNYIKHILKASHNIIDLIEVGDYVNGVLVESIYSKEEDKMRFHTFEAEIMIEVTKENINNIVTKEQFESMSYKVGE